MNDTETRITRNHNSVGLLPYRLEYLDGGEWETFGGFNTRSAAEWQALSVFGTPRSHA